MINKFCWVIGVLLILFVSCKKDKKDSSTPVITISSPNDGNLFSVGDTILIQGNITDNDIIKSLSISLNNSNGIPTGNSINKIINSPSYTINDKIVLDDELMESGSYTLKIMANDTENSSIVFINVFINELPKKRNGFILFSANGGGTNIVKLDSVLNSTYLYNVTGDFFGGLVNSVNQEIISCGSLSGDLIAYSLNQNSEVWNIQNNAAGSSNFTGLNSFGNQVYLGLFNQNIQSYLKGGIPSFSAQSITNFYVEEIFKHDNDLLITEQKHKTNAETRLVAYYLASGVEKQNLIINKDVVNLYSASENELIVFSNANGNGEIHVFDVNQNSIWKPFDLSMGLISDCTEVSNGKYLIIQNGDVILVDYNNFSKVTFLSGINAQKIKYDNLYHQVIVLSGMELSVYDYFTKTKMTSYINSEAISDFDIWYNR